MGTIASKSQRTSIEDRELSEALRSTLKDLKSLYIVPRLLKIDQNSLLGEGGFGEVLVAQLRESRRKSAKVAVKQLRPVGATGDRRKLAVHLARELKIWAKLKHQNILPLVGFYLSDDYRIARLVSKYMSHGNISQYISQQNPGIDTRLKFVQDITAGMDYLHSYPTPICHGDLKPLNVLISDNLEAVLCDFGLAAFIDASGLSSGLTTTRAVKGSVRYMSPELLQGTIFEHTLSSDVWSWACTSFEVITDLKPYASIKEDNAALAATIRGIPPGDVKDLLTRVPGGIGWSQNTPDVVIRCWDFAPEKRPTMNDLLKACRSSVTRTVD